MMNNSVWKVISTAVLLTNTANLFADDALPLNPAVPDSGTQQVAKYLNTLGKYLGYDLNAYCPETGGPCSSSTSGQNLPTANYTNLLLNSTLAYSNQINLITSFIGALLPSATKQSGSTQQAYQLIPSNSAQSGYNNLFNQYANSSFAQQTSPYSSPSAGSFSVSPLLDQQPYQSDPVSQSILNILSTPDASFCINSEDGTYNNPCYTGNNNSTQFGGGPVLSQNQIMINTVGNPFPQPPNYPGTGYFALGSKNASLVPQLSSDSLLGPLMFDNSGQTQSSTSSSPSGTNPGLTAQNQVQQAANFIRYATGAATPLSLPNRNLYDKLYAIATNQAGNVKPADQTKAQVTLSSYLNSLRVYAAQTSVSISNLYYILSKRMPQNTATGANNSQQQTSQALSEYAMATWRLYSPQTGSNNQQWLAQINQASSATVQKEIAILLAEINYQLYLSRQQQERLLLTNSMLLLQVTKQASSLPVLGGNNDSNNPTTLDEIQ